MPAQTSCSDFRANAVKEVRVCVDGDKIHPKPGRLVGGPTRAELEVPFCAPQSLEEPGGGFRTVEVRHVRHMEPPWPLAYRERNPLPKLCHSESPLPGRNSAGAGCAEGEICEGDIGVDWLDTVAC